MNKVISVFKKHWNKAVAVFCVVAIVFVTSVSFSSSASADVIEDNDHMDLETDLNKVLTKAILGKDWSEVVAEYFDVFYETISINYWNVNTSLFPQYGDDGLFTDGYLSENGKKYEGYYMSPPIDWDQFVLYAQEKRKSELDSSTLDSNDYVKKNNVDPVKISTDDLKALYTDYSLIYAPMPTPSQYLYNYQSATGEKQTAGYHEFAPCAPLWRSGLGFGADIGSKGGWKKDCYVLPYIYDDDVGSTYYYSGYWHFTIEVDEFYKATYTCDFVSLLGDEDSTQFHLTKSHEYRAYALKVSSGAWIQCFTSDTSYLQGNLALNTSYATVVNAPAAKTTYAVSGKLSDLVKNNFGNMLRATTFTPQTNTADDWGYIMSETPFELFKDQTSIDFSRIPNNYTITINGDTIYDYSITNPDTGDSTTIKKYIDDDYDFPQVPDVPDVPDPGDDSGTGGKVEVSGKIDVSGKVDVDVNVNVNSGSSSNPDPGDYINPGTVDTNLDHYLEQVPELSKGFIDYLKDFFAWLPDKIYGLIILGLIVMIFCRLAGR